MMTDGKKEIITYWYKKLGFPEKYDKEFQEALETYQIPDGLTVDTYDMEETDGKRNLLSYLYFCEALKDAYQKKGIPEEILLDTLSDMVIWTNTWSDLKGELHLSQLNWLKHHLSMKLFKIGRLQYYLAEASHYRAVPEENLQVGDPILDIHIPAVGPLTPEECARSIAMAKEFFAKYFPEHRYQGFVCHSWLLDESLKEILPADSNILQFQKLFNLYGTEPSDAILRFVFCWNTTRENLREFPAKSFLAEAVKRRLENGGSFYETTGVIKS